MLGICLLWDCSIRNTVSHTHTHLVVPAKACISSPDSLILEAGSGLRAMAGGSTVLSLVLNLNAKRSHRRQHAVPLPLDKSSPLQLV